jgi:hypothetical protein
MTETISIALGSNVISVTGSINGEVVDFVSTASQVWTAEAVKAIDGRYELDILVENDVNLISHYNFAIYQLYGWTNPVYDRTQWDVDHETEKGFLNYHDLNRVETNCQFLSDTLVGYGYPVSIQTKLDWTSHDFPFIAELERITLNIQTLREGFYALPETPAIPQNLEVLYYYKLNDIEKILFDLKSILDLMVQIFRRSGTFYSGGEHYGVGSF